MGAIDEAMEGVLSTPPTTDCKEMEEEVIELVCDGGAGGNCPVMLLLLLLLLPAIGSVDEPATCVSPSGGESFCCRGCLEVFGTTLTVLYPYYRHW